MPRRLPVAALLLAAFATSTAPAGAARSRVVTVVMENREASSVLGSPDAPYVNRLAARYGVATASFGVTHPSLPNYIALTSGGLNGITTNCTDCHTGARNIVDQLQRAGISWKAYMEDLPRPCFTGDSSGAYVRRHNPFLYYDSVTGDAARCRRVVPLTRLSSDLRAGTVPAYVFLSPGLCNDGHDCPTTTADRFLAQWIPRLLRVLGPRGFLILTWDEGTTTMGCCGDSTGGRIATVVAGPGVRRGGRMSRPVDHYGVLRTVERALGLPLLGRAADPGHGSLAPLFARAPRVRAAG